MTGWAGDSRAVLGKGASWDTMVGVDLTRDHKPDLPQEKERIVVRGAPTSQPFTAAPAVRCQRSQR